jgi:carbonic anhydrase
MSHSTNPGFADIWRANEDYAKSFKYRALTGRAARGLAIVTCMDSRINPLSVVGMKSGDAKILRNAGGRVTEDVLRTLVLATFLLGVDRILVMPHTDCRMAQEDEEVIHAMIEEKHGVDTRSLEFNTVVDQRASLSQDLARIRAFPLLPKRVVVSGGIYHVETGVIEPIDN